MNEMAKTVRENNIQVSLGGGDEGSQLALILAVDILEGDDSGSLLVDDGSQTGLALHNSVRDTHLAAQRGKEDNQLDRVNIVGDQDQRGLLVLDQTNDVVETVLDEEGLLGVLLGK